MPDRKGLPPSFKPLAPEGLPPSFKPIEEQPEESELARAWRLGNTSVLETMPVEMKRAISDNPLVKSVTGKYEQFKQNHPYMGVAADTVMGIPHFMTTPIGAALSLTGASSGMARLAGLGRTAKALEVPAKAAAAGMIGHGVYGVATGETGPQKFSSAIEAGLGIMGSRSHESPVEQPKLPKLQAKPRLGIPETTSGTDFYAGPAGVAENRPYAIDMGPTNPRMSGGLYDKNVMFGNNEQGSVLPGELMGVNQIPPDLAARHGIAVGRPTSEIAPEQSVVDKFLGRYQPTSQLALPPRRFELPEKMPESSTEQPVPEVMPSANPVASDWLSKLHFTDDPIKDQLDVLKAQHDIRTATQRGETIPHSDELPKPFRYEIPARLSPEEPKPYEGNLTIEKLNELSSKTSAHRHEWNQEFTRRQRRTPEQIYENPFKLTSTNPIEPDRGLIATEQGIIPKRPKQLIPELVDRFGPDWVKVIHAYDEKARKYGLTPEGNPDPVRLAEARRIEDEAKLREGHIEQPMYAKVHTDKGDIAKIGVNVARSAEELTTGYSASLPSIMVREGMQNSLDAVKDLGMNGNINVKINRTQSANDPRGSIEVIDNGKGMSPEELYTVYTNLHESGKATEEGAVGGKGVGKASYMLGGDHFEVVTVKNINGQKIESSFSGTPSELMEGFKISSKVVPAETPTGTRFKTTLREDQGLDTYAAQGMIDKIQQWSRDIPYKIYKSINQSDDAVPMRSFKDDKLITKEPVDNGNSDLELYIPQNTKFGESSSVMMRVLNNGMYQFSKDYYLGEKYNGIPEDVIVNVKSKVPEGHRNYPFPVQRESVKSNIETEIGKIIEDKLAKPLGNKKKVDLMKLWKDMTPIPVKGSAREVVFYDPGNRLKPGEKLDFQTNPVMVQFAELMDKVVDGILRTSKNDKWIDRVERIGITLDADAHGVHIPNPMTGKSAIMINPFPNIAMRDPGEASLNIVVTALHEAAHVGSEAVGDIRTAKLKPEDMTDPRVGQYLQTYLKETIEQGGVDMGHGMAFLHRLASLYSTYGTRRGVGAADAIQQIFESGATEPGQYGPEIQKLLQVYSESRRRPETTTDILTGTGTKSTNRAKGTGPVPSNAKPDPERIASERIAINKLRSAIQSGALAREQQNTINRTEHAERAGKYESVKAEGLAGFYKKMGQLSGKFPEVRSGALDLNQGEVDALFSSITNSVTLRPYEQVNAGTGLLRLMSGRPPTEYQLKMLNNIFGDDFGELVQLYGGFGQGLIKEGVTAKQIFREAVNLPKSFMAAMDLSAPLRQGLPLFGTKAYRDSFVDMFKYFGSQKAYDGLMDAIDNRPLSDLSRVGGLAITDITDVIARREEAFLSHWAETGEFLAEPHLKAAYQHTIGAGIKASDRAYTGFLDKLRADTFDDLIGRAEKIGILDLTRDAEGAYSPETIQMAKKFADFVNTATGRGSLNFGKGKMFQYDKIATDMNALFFSPRMIASRLRMLAYPVEYFTEKNPIIRQQKLAAVLRVAGVGMTMATLAHLNGKEVNMDPSNSDFMKVKVGNTRFDPWAGFQQYIVGFYRFLSGKSTSSNSGKTTELNTGKYNSPSRLDVLYSSSPYHRGMIENKLSPIASLINDMVFKGTQEGGTQPFNLKESMIQRFEPMVMQDLTAVYQNDPDILPAAAAAAIFGMGVQSYKPQMPHKRLNLDRKLSLRR